MLRDLGYLEKILNGTATARKPIRSAPAPPHQSPGTTSDIVPYYIAARFAGFFTNSLAHPKAFHVAYGLVMPCTEQSDKRVYQCDA